jgi:hypothetical protein
VPKAEQGLVPYDSQILSNAGQVGVDLTALLASVPEADDDAYVGIIRQLMSAESVADLDAPWTTRSLEAFVDSPLRVLNIHKMPSDFDEGLGTYLVVDAVVPGLGEKFTVTTGSVNVVVQLVKAHTLGALPLLCIPRRSKRPTANGYYPMHLEIVRAQ